MISASASERAASPRLYTPETTMTDIARVRVPSIDFDHHAASFVADKEEIYRRLHAECPIAFTQAYGGFFVVSGFDDINSIAQNPAVFSSDNDTDGSGGGGRGIMIPPNEVRMGFVEMDPPELMRYRRPLTKWFAPRAVEAFKPRLRTFLEQVVRAAQEKQSFDVVDDLANPTAAIAILAMMGLPTDGWEHYARPFHEIVYQDRTAPEFEQVMERVGAAMSSIQQLVTDRRAKRTDDLVTALLETEVAGETMGDATIVNLIFMTMVGGMDTSTAVITNGIRYLYEHPDERAACRRDPELLHSACREFLRFYSPSTGAARNVMCPTTVRGVELSPGDRVLLLWGAANRDPRVFTDPDEVDIRREPNPHLAFGSGIHRCIGIALAVAEVEAFFSALLESMPDYVVDVDRCVPYPSHGIINSYSVMPASAGLAPMAGW
jgi:cytochrome P450